MTGKSGVKYDQEKVRLDLVIEGFARALREVAEVATFGANKYSENGWVTVENAHKRYTSAMYRHLNSESCGEQYDNESMFLHSAHAAWNALARLELELRDKE